MSFAAAKIWLPLEGKALRSCAGAALPRIRQAPNNIPRSTYSIFFLLSQKGRCGRKFFRATAAFLFDSVYSSPLLSSAGAAGAGCSAGAAAGLGPLRPFLPPYRYWHSSR